MSGIDWFCRCLEITMVLLIFLWPFMLYQKELAIVIKT